MLVHLYQITRRHLPEDDCSEPVPWECQNSMAAGRPRKTPDSCWAKKRANNLLFLWCPLLKNNLLFMCIILCCSPLPKSTCLFLLALKQSCRTTIERCLITSSSLLYRQCFGYLFGRFPAWILARTLDVLTDDVICSFTQLSAFFSVASPRCRAMASPLSFLQPFVFPAAAFQFRIWSKFRASLQTASFHLFLGFPTDLLPPKHPLLFVESSVFTTWPAHCNLFRRKNVGMPHAHTICISLRYRTLP